MQFIVNSQEADFKTLMQTEFTGIFLNCYAHAKQPVQRQHYTVKTNSKINVLKPLLLGLGEYFKSYGF